MYMKENRKLNNKIQNKLKNGKKLKKFKIGKTTIKKRQN